MLMLSLIVSCVYILFSLGFDVCMLILATSIFIFCAGSTIFRVRSRAKFPKISSANPSRIILGNPLQFPM